MIKELLLDIIDFCRYKVENNECTDADMRNAFELLSDELSCEATISDLAKHYRQSENNVRNVIARKYIGKPTRRVSYDYRKIIKVIPRSWITGKVK